MVTTSPRVMDFTQLDKKEIDWRFVRANHLSNIAHKNNAPSSETIHWIGIIEPATAKQFPEKCLISFISDHKRMTNDQAYTRDADGAPGSIFPVSYDLRCIAQQLQHNAPYLNLLLEETVNRHGEHSVSLLWNKVANKPYVFYSDELWHTQPSASDAYHTKLSTNTIERKIILSSNRYNWMK